MNDIYDQNKKAQEEQFQKKLVEKRAQIEARQQKEVAKQKQGGPHADPFNINSFIANAAKLHGLVPTVRDTKESGTKHQR